MGIIEVHHLTKYFGGVAAADSLEFQVEQGEILGVIGPNGSGKTSLFNLITGIYKPTEGEILFDGKNIAGRKPYEILERGIARTFQATRLFSEIDVLHNVMIGFHSRTKTGFGGVLLGSSRARKEEKEVPEKATQLLHFMHLHHVRDKLAGNITGAEQRRLMITIALATDPRVLLLDEPTAGISMEEASELLELIMEIRNRGMTVLLIEHNMKVAMGISDRMIVLNFGKKIAEGVPKEIAENEDVIEAYLGRD